MNAPNAQGTPSSRRTTIFLVALWALVTATTFAASGCYGHNCVGDWANYGQNPGEGQLVDDNTWQSGPVDGLWLPFPKQQTYYFDLHELGVDRLPTLVIPYVSAQANPLQEGGNYTIAGGNLAEISGADRGRVTIHNGTCADYFLRVLVQAPQRANGAAPPANDDAGDEDASASDASVPSEAPDADTSLP